MHLGLPRRRGSDAFGARREIIVDRPVHVEGARPGRDFGDAARFGPGGLLLPEALADAAADQAAAVLRVAGEGERKGVGAVW